MTPTAARQDLGAYWTIDPVELLRRLNASADLTELVVALVVRTRRPFFRSRPGTVLLVSTLILIPVAFAIPFMPYANWLGFVPAPAGLLIALAGIMVLYVIATELMKSWLYRSVTL